METAHLTKHDYHKVLYFISKITESGHNYQYQVLSMLDQIFGFKYTTFNLIDDSTLTMFCPIVNNITDISTKQYYQYYFKTDIFNPQNNINLLLNKSVLSIKDIMSFSDFENTEYYSDFLKKDMLYYEVAVPLKYENKLLGALGIFKPKTDKDFTAKEISILRTLNKFISDELYKFLWIQGIKKEYQIYNYCVKENPTGIIILTKDYALVYANKKAEEICQDICPSKKIEDSVKQLAYQLCENTTLDWHISSSGLSLKHKAYFFHLSSTAISSIYGGIDTVYVIHISPKATNKRTLSTCLTKYKLTGREEEIIYLLQKGLTNQEIAQELYISKHTVKTHMENIFKKLNVSNRTAVLHKLNNIST